LRLQLSPAVASLLQEIGRFRTKLRDVMTDGLDPGTIRVTANGLCQMKTKLTQWRAAAAE
jgi:hypothetical protein